MWNNCISSNVFCSSLERSCLLGSPLRPRCAAKGLTSKSMGSQSPICPFLPSASSRPEAMRRMLPIA